MRKEIRIAGIDEAGRGCVIGPMVLAGVQIDSRDSEEFTRIGVTDSKRLTPKKRLQLAEAILKIAQAHFILEIPPQQIDVYCARGRLNVLEAETACLIIRRLTAQKIYVDAPGKGGKKFREQLVTLLDDPAVEIIAENFADLHYPVTGAASILAKVNRDRAVEMLRREVGDFGSGYPADPKTRRFLRDILRKNTPCYIRHSWETVQKLRGRELFE